MNLDTIIDKYEWIPKDRLCKCEFCRHVRIVQEAIAGFELFLETYGGYDSEDKRIFAIYMCIAESMACRLNNLQRKTRKSYIVQTFMDKLLMKAGYNIAHPDNMELYMEGEKKTAH